MAKENENGAERTEEPTSKRRQEAREKGQVCKSQEISTAFLFAGTVLAFTFYIPSMSAKLAQAVSHYLGSASDWDGSADMAVTLLTGAAQRSGSLLLPIFAVFLVIGLVSNFVQIGFLVSAEAIKPKFSKLNPITGIKNKFFSIKSLEQLVKSLVIVCVVGLVAYRAIRREVPFFPPLLDSDPSVIVLTLYRSCMHLLWDALWLFILIAVADYSFQKWQHTQDLMMSKQEVKDEMKQTEGNPQIKSRIRSIQIQMARRRMMKEVPKADVVITNPTHLAVALKYDRGQMVAPVVVAKGAGVVAEKIKDVARSSQIPIVENKPLARALFRSVELGEAVPEDLYKAVAEILAYVYRLRAGGING